MAAGSPTRFNNIYLGERYDATLEAQFEGEGCGNHPEGTILPTTCLTPGWNRVGFHDAGWTPAVVAGSVASLSVGKLVPQVPRI